MCPGNRVVFTCQQTSTPSRWTINLPSITLQNSAQSSLVGSILTFGNDPVFHFELHIVSNSSNRLTSELQVTAVRELNGVRVECTGINGTFVSTIRVASVGELTSVLLMCAIFTTSIKFEDPPDAPSGVMTTNEQFIRAGATVTLTWSTSRGADNYTVRVIPSDSIMAGQISEFTTTDTNLQLIAVYNVNYFINITTQNCVGSNSTTVPLIVGELATTSCS